MKMHVLARTETLEMLSARYGVPVCMIIRANHLGAEDRLFAGRKLQIPPVDYCWKAEETSGEEEAKSGKQGTEIRIPARSSSGRASPFSKRMAFIVV